MNGRQKEDLSVYLKSSGEFSNSRYYVTCEKPSFVQQNKLQNYGITHIILFSDYDEIYQALYDAGSEAQKISVDDMEDISSLTEIKLNNDFTNNKPYLFHGKGLIENRAGQWRYRIGDYRVICEIKDDEIIVLILDVGHRRNIYG